MARMKTAILLGAAIGLAAALRPRRAKAGPSPYQDPTVYDWKVPPGSTLVESDESEHGWEDSTGYVPASVFTRIYEYAQGLFLYRWRWPKAEGGAGGFANLEETRRALEFDMGEKLIPG